MAEPAAVGIVVIGGHRTFDRVAAISRDGMAEGANVVFRKGAVAVYSQVATGHGMSALAFVMSCLARQIYG